MAMKSEILQICGITSVFGNVPVEQATGNALMTAEICGGRYRTWSVLRNGEMDEIRTFEHPGLQQNRQ